MIDLLFCAKGRPEFTRESMRALATNTVRCDLHVYTDGADEAALIRPYIDCFDWEIHRERFGSPVAIMQHFLKQGDSEIVCKIDNDVIVPPGWLEQCLAIMEAHPELDLLGIEPWRSRTANPQTGQRGDEPDREGWVTTSNLIKRFGMQIGCHWASAYAQTRSIGGIGLFRRRAFERFPDLRAEGTYGGFTSWQLRHPELVIGWCVPPLKLFLLDRLPMDPWKSLSRRYVAEGQQRPWTDYSPEVAQELAGWWLK